MRAGRGRAETVIVAYAPTAQSADTYEGAIRQYLLCQDHSVSLPLHVVLANSSLVQHAFVSKP
jgi:hypothetical protein